MINTKIQTSLVFFCLMLFGCIQPDQESLWSTSVEKTINTSGFSRDVHMQGDTAFIVTQDFHLTFPEAIGSDFGCDEGDYLYFIWRTPENLE